MIASPSRSEALARSLLKSFFQVDIPAKPRPLARQPKPADDLLLPLRPDPEDPGMLKCHLPVWGRRDPGAPQARERTKQTMREAPNDMPKHGEVGRGRPNRDSNTTSSAAISAKLVKERPRRHKVLWLRKAAPADWRADLHRLVDDFEAGKVQFHPAGLVCNGDFCWYSRLAMSGRDTRTKSTRNPRETRTYP